METSSSTVKLRSINPHFVAFDITGEVSSFAEDEMMAAVSQSVEMGVKGIILNFKELQYMTSSGIGLLVTMFIRTSRKDIRMYAVGLSQHYQKIFELTRLSQNIPVYSTEEEVLANEQLA
jgi:anti-sigma B factor antagonist